MNRTCGFFKTCNEALVFDQIIGTVCNFSQQIITDTCQDFLCVEGQECLLVTFEGNDESGNGGTIQTCPSTEHVDRTVAIVQQLRNNQ